MYRRKISRIHSSNLLVIPVVLRQKNYLLAVVPTRIRSAWQLALEIVPAGLCFRQVC